MLKLKFYPSYSSMTFPMVISAIATNATYLYLQNEGINIPGMMYLVYFEIAVAVIIVLYVLARYIHHFLLRKHLAALQGNG